MNRKRLWIWAVLACLPVGILAACDPTDPPSVEETSGITEVTSVSEEAPTDPETDPETLPVTESDTAP